MENLSEINSCRSCGSEKLKEILSLGEQYVTNFVNSKEDQEKVPQVPLELILCENCKLLQLKHNAPPESMWGDQYWYKSGISSTIKKDLRDIAEKGQNLIGLEKGDFVVDIGCNDGTLLSFYDKNFLELVGFEPSRNVSKESIAKGFKIINNFFNVEDFKKKFGNKKAKLITAISMFYDLEDPNKFLKDITEILDKEGLFIIQQNYLISMLEQNAFDNICHEHREYYSLFSLKNILEKYNLEIFDISLSDINGGSIRTYIKFKSNQKLKGFQGSEDRIKKILEKEKFLGIDTLKPYEEFANRILQIKKNLLDFLEKEKEKKVWIYGASTRGNVILQYFGLNQNLIESIADKNEDKNEKKTVGSLIPITTPEKMREENPDYLLVNVWHFFKEIEEQEKEWHEKGGKFIVPLPEFRIV